MVIFPEETEAYRLQFLRYEAMTQVWELKTKLYPTEAAAVKEALELNDPSKYASVSIKRITGDSK